MLPYVGCVVLYIVIISSLLFVVHKHNRGVISCGSYRLYFLLFIIFGTFAYYTGDYAHYQDEVARLHTNLLSSTHLEMVYVLLVDLTNGNYTLWRLCVFSVMFLLLHIFLKSSNQNTSYALFWYALLILPSAVSGRSPIGILSFFIGIILIIKGGYHYLLAILFFFFAVIGHKSIVPLFLLIPFTKFRFNSKLYPLLLLVLPIMGIIIESLFIGFLINHNLIDEEYYKGYIQYEAPFLSSIGGVVEFLVYTLPYNFFVLAFIVKMLKAKNHDDLYVHLKNVCFVLIVILIVALFIFGFTNPMFYRYYEMLKYPLLLLLPFVFPKLYQMRFTYGNILFLFVFLGGQVFRIMLWAFYEYLK